MLSLGTQRSVLHQSEEMQKIKYLISSSENRCHNVLTDTRLCSSAKTDLNVYLEISGICTYRSVIYYVLSSIDCKLYEKE